MVDETIATLQSIFGDLSVLRGDSHTYLGIDLEFHKSGELTASMVNYFCSIVDDFPKKYGTIKTPAATHLFGIDDSAEKLPK